jgi:hypothetical protein
LHQSETDPSKKSVDEDFWQVAQQLGIEQSFSEVLVGSDQARLNVPEIDSTGSLIPKTPAADFIFKKPLSPAPRVCRNIPKKVETRKADIMNDSGEYFSMANFALGTFQASGGPSAFDVVQIHVSRVEEVEDLEWHCQYF